MVTTWALMRVAIAGSEMSRENCDTVLRWINNPKGGRLD
jgi:hypothetical protein